MRIEVNLGEETPREAKWLESEELIKQEEKELLADFFRNHHGEVPLGRPFMKRGMKERCVHLLKLSSRFPDGDVRRDARLTRYIPRGG